MTRQQRRAAKREASKTATPISHARAFIITEGTLASQHLLAFMDRLTSGESEARDQHHRLLSADEALERIELALDRATRAPKGNGAIALDPIVEIVLSGPDAGTVRMHYPDAPKGMAHELAEYLNATKSAQGRAH